MKLTMHADGNSEGTQLTKQKIVLKVGHLRCHTLNVELRRIWSFRSSGKRILSIGAAGAGQKLKR